MPSSLFSILYTIAVGELLDYLRRRCSLELLWRTIFDKLLFAKDPSQPKRQYVLKGPKSHPRLLKTIGHLYTINRPKLRPSSAETLSLSMLLYPSSLLR
mmetsp:Transcript_134248/g.388631  ORF Transcript_134248/g.388631 Transcript_134248/m.388631 type:complete len:99 (-) Transcript_134248:515-811(-)